MGRPSNPLLAACSLLAALTMLVGPSQATEPATRDFHAIVLGGGATAQDAQRLIDRLPSLVILRVHKPTIAHGGKIDAEPIAGLDDAPYLAIAGVCGYPAVAESMRSVLAVLGGAEGARVVPVKIRAATENPLMRTCPRWATPDEKAEQAARAASIKATAKVDDRITKLEWAVYDGHGPSGCPQRWVALRELSRGEHLLWVKGYEDDCATARGKTCGTGCQITEYTASITSPPGLRLALVQKRFNWGDAATTTLTFFGAGCGEPKALLETAIGDGDELLRTETKGALGSLPAEIVLTVANRRASKSERVERYVWDAKRCAYNAE